MITAQQAKQLSEDFKKPSSYVFDAIESMAKAGRDYATFEKAHIRDTSELKKLVIDAGFVVEESESYLTIKW